MVLGRSTTHFKFHLLENILFDVDTFGNLGQHQALCRHLEHCAFGNDCWAMATVDDAAADGISNLLDGVDELGASPPVDRRHGGTKRGNLDYPIQTGGGNQQEVLP